MERTHSASLQRAKAGLEAFRALSSKPPSEITYAQEPQSGTIIAAPYITDEKDVDHDHLSELRKRLKPELTLYSPYASGPSTSDCFASLRGLKDLASLWCETIEGLAPRASILLESSQKSYLQLLLGNSDMNDTDQLHALLEKLTRYAAFRHSILAESNRVLYMSENSFRVQYKPDAAARRPQGNGTNPGDLKKAKVELDLATQLGVSITALLAYTAHKKYMRFVPTPDEGEKPVSREFPVEYHAKAPEGQMCANNLTPFGGEWTIDSSGTVSLSLHSWYRSRPIDHWNLPRFSEKRRKRVDPTHEPRLEELLTTDGREGGLTKYILAASRYVENFEQQKAQRLDELHTAQKDQNFSAVKLAEFELSLAEDHGARLAAILARLVDQSGQKVQNLFEKVERDELGSFSPAEQATYYAIKRNFDVNLGRNAEQMISIAVRATGSGALTPDCTPSSEKVKIAMGNITANELERDGWWAKAFSGSKPDPDEPISLEELRARAARRGCQNGSRNDSPLEQLSTEEKLVREHETSLDPCASTSPPKGEWEKDDATDQGVFEAGAAGSRLNNEDLVIARRKPPVQVSKGAIAGDEPEAPPTDDLFPMPEQSKDHTETVTVIDETELETQFSNDPTSHDELFENLVDIAKLPVLDMSEEVFFRIHSGVDALDTTDEISDAARQDEPPVTFSPEDLSYVEEKVYLESLPPTADGRPVIRSRYVSRGVYVGSASSLATLGGSTPSQERRVHWAETPEFVPGSSSGRGQEGD